MWHPWLSFQLGCWAVAHIRHQLPDSMVLTSLHFVALHVSVVLWGRPDPRSAETLSCHYRCLGGDRTEASHLHPGSFLRAARVVLSGWLWDKLVSVESPSPEWPSIKLDTNGKWSQPSHWTFQILENLTRVEFVTHLQITLIHCCSLQSVTTSSAVNW